MSDVIHASGAAGGSSESRLLGIDTPLGPGAVTLLSLDGEDVLSRCFLYRIVVLTAETDAAVQSLLGMPVTLWLVNSDADRRRPIHGHVRRAVGNGTDLHGNRRYRLEVVPRLWFLSCTADCRIFQNLSVPDILSTVFADQGLTNVELRVVRANYLPLDYCVQYRESALDFVSRLMEHLGMFYWHEHSADKHVLVIADRNAAADTCDPASVSLSSYGDANQLRTLEIDCSFRPGKWTLNDYDFESPTKQLLVDTPTMLTVPRMKDHEIYEYPGDFKDQDAGRNLSRLRVELEESQQLRVFGTGLCAGFDPGRRVTVTGAAGTPAVMYLLTEVRHHATSIGLEASDAEGPKYSNEFVAIKADLPFRPERITQKPHVRGAQTATVVGPAGENIYCDPFGRVRVQFHWDRRGQRNDQSSCWMRVAQARSGSNYGTLVIPHVGHEVLISFIEGDPDRPLIVGTVPNALTMPPVMLPGDKNKTVQRDHGDNKFVMQGKAGKESVSMVSPRAVNMFASGRTARPLSASLSFSDDPTSNAGLGLSNTGAPAWNPNSSTPAASTATSGSYTIDEYQDSTGLQQVYNEWWGTVMSDTDQADNYSLTQNFTPDYTLNADGTLSPSASSPSTTFSPTTGPSTTSATTTYTSSGGGTITVTGTPTTANGVTTYGPPYTSVESGLGTTSSSGSYGTQDGDAADSYLNWGSEGRINCVVLSNNNLWVYGNGNTWINGDVNTQINGDSTTVIGGYDYGASTSTSAVETTIWGSNNTRVYGANASTNLGDNTTTVIGTNQAFNLAVNIAINAGLNLSQSGISFSESNMAFSYTLLQMSAVDVNFETTAALSCKASEFEFNACALLTFL